MQIIPIKTPVLKTKPVDAILNIIKKNNIIVNDNDILVLTSKIISFEEKRLIKLSTVAIGKRAKTVAEQYNIDPQLTQLVINEADQIIDIIAPFFLTLKNGIFIPNAGIDKSNAPKGYVALWPKLPYLSAQTAKNKIKKKFGKNVGVIIADSQCPAGRQGTTGITIGIAGFEGITRKVGGLDLFGKSLWRSYHNIADELSGMANFLMGELNEQIPAVIIKNAGITLSGKSAKILTAELTKNPNRDMFRKLYQNE